MTPISRGASLRTVPGWATDYMNAQFLKYKSVLLLFFLYFALGNILRLIPMASSIGSVNTFEIVLHCYCLLVLLLSLREVSRFPVAEYLHTRTSPFSTMVNALQGSCAWKMMSFLA